MMVVKVDFKTQYRIPEPLSTKGGFGEQMGRDSNKDAVTFMTEDLANSGLTPEQAFSKPYFLRRQHVKSSYYLPYFDLNGNVIVTSDRYPMMYRLKQDLEANAPKKVGKYSQPSQSDIDDLAKIPYLHPRFHEIEDETVLICEGEKKALSAMVHLDFPAIGIGGCWNWQDHGEVHEWILRALAQKDASVVVIVPDGDVRRYDIARAYGTLASKLRLAGYEVSLLQLPNNKDKLDDLIVKWGAEAGDKFGELPVVQGLVEAPGSLIATYELATKQMGRGENAHQVPELNEINYLKILRGHPAFKHIWFNDDTDSFMAGDEPFKPDITEMDILGHLQYNLGFGKASHRQVMLALRTVARERAKSPFLEHITNVKWDGEERLETMFIDYAGAPDTAVVRSVGKRWLPAAVRRMLKPGTLVDYMVIAVGAQGIGKSSFPRILWGEDAVVDYLGNYDGKDAAMIMHSGLLVNWEELSYMTRHKEVGHLKATITAKEDTYRTPYSASVESRRRRFVMYGSVNDTEFLPNDPTGLRRFPVVPMTQVAFAALEADKDQLWGEAMVKAQDWELDTTGIPEANEDSKQYVKSDPLYDEFKTKLANDNSLVWFDIPSVAPTCLAFKLSQVLILVGLDPRSSASLAAKTLRDAMLADGWVCKDNIRLDGKQNGKTFILSKADYEQW